VKRCVLLLAMLAAMPAFAEDIVAYQAEGDAPASGSDARTMALDEAFANAVTNALTELVAADTRTARKAELDKEIIGRARIWVAKFSVTKDETVDTRRELTVSVRIDRDKLRARLTELGIAMKETTGSTGAGDPTAASATRTATVLLRVMTPAGIRADFGASAEKDVPGLAAITNVLRTNGYAVRRAPATGGAPSGESELPLSDEEAEGLAAEAKADVVAIAGVKVGAPVAVRGQATTAALVTAHVRIVDRKERKVIGQGVATAGAKGADPGYAIDRALVGAANDVMPPAAARLSAAGSFSGEDRPVVEPGIVLVRLPARTSYASVLLEQKYLAGAKGVRAATLRRLSPGGWVIGVATGEPIEQIARIAKKAPSTDTSASVKIVGDIVEVTLSGAP
jgi:hypothetical protein